MNKTTIDWKNIKAGWELDYTWNPIYGCKQNCHYCYAKRLHDEFMIRFGKSNRTTEQYKKPFSEIQFFPDRLKQPFRQYRPSTIFVGSMSDIYWHEKENIESILAICRLSPEHRFLFLTKHPSIYNNFNFSDNCWLGVTVVSPEVLKNSEMFDFVENNFPNKFLSIEPILGDFTDINLNFVSWIVAGPQTGKGGKKAYLPDWKKNSIKHDNIYWKNEIV